MTGLRSQQGRCLARTLDHNGALFLGELTEFSAGTRLRR